MEGAERLLPWSLADIPYDLIDCERVRGNEALFFLLAAASLVESGSDLYTRNLLGCFADDTEVSTWLSAHWEPEELQHGRALAAYIARVWPWFDWQAVYLGFLDEYAALARPEELEATRALEMASRCVVETGTAVYYRALERHAEEPVLKDLCGRIADDEVRHYKHFLRYFRGYGAAEAQGRWPVFGALVRRVIDIRNEDMECAVRHVFRHASHAERFTAAQCASPPFTLAAGDERARLAEIRRMMFRAIRAGVDTTMALKMFLRPLALPPSIERGVHASLATIARHFQ